jgi:hypothetical protein
MTKLVLTGDLSRQLTSIHGCVALCDDTGQTIGFFTPAAPDSPRGPRVNDEELDRRDREEPIFTTDDVLAHLRSL